MFYLDNFSDDAAGFTANSTSSEWEAWLSSVIPNEAHEEVRRRLRSNLKHIIVGLEMKAGLLIPHGEKLVGRPVLFEPYSQIMTFEFCVGTFSVCEGLGSILHLTDEGDDGSSGKRVPTKRWISALIEHFDEDDDLQLSAGVEVVKSVRDLLHQDRLGAREDIDWHSMGYKEAFLPALSAMRGLLNQQSDRVPEKTILIG